MFLRGTIIDVAERRVKVLMTGERQSTPYIDCLNSIKDEELKKGKQAVVIVNQSYSESIVIGVIG